MAFSGISSANRKRGNVSSMVNAMACQCHQKTFMDVSFILLTGSCFNFSDQHWSESTEVQGNLKI